MVQKFRLFLITVVIMTFASLTISATGGLNKPLAQTGMGMATDTPQPQTPQMQDTPTPGGNNPAMGLPSPTWTSIFTGYTPYPNMTPMAGSAMGSGMMGRGMNLSSQDTTGAITGSMTSSNCPMMSGMGSMGGMGAMDMGGGSSMPGMDMGSNYAIEGMDMYGTSGYVQTSPSDPFSNPWLLIGWVLLAVLIFGILAAIVVAIIWLIRRSKPPQTA
jgi:hypothetical protein